MTTSTFVFGLNPLLKSLKRQTRPKDVCSRHCTCHGALRAERPRAQLNIGTGTTGAFSIAADAAFNMTLDPPFTPYANNLFFIHGAFIFEDVGVTAYQVRRRVAVVQEHYPSLMPSTST